MMKTNLLKLYSIIAISFFALPLLAQKGIEDGSTYGHNEDSINCRKNLSLYKTYFTQKNYDMSLVFWHKVINECPRSSKNLYLHGIKMFKSLYTKTKNKAYVDSVVLVYDLRIKYFGEEAYHHGRKGMDLWNIGSSDAELVKMSYDFLDKSISLAPEKSAPNSLMIFMAASQKLFKSGSITGEKVIENYGKLNDILTKRIAAVDRVPDKEAKNKIDAIFKASGAGSCEGIAGLFSAKIKAKPNDASLLKLVLSLLDDSNCNDSDLFYSAAENLYKIEKSALAAYSLAELNKNKNNFNQAEKYYREAIEMEDDNLKKANYYIKISGFRINKQDFKGARDLAKKAISLDPSNGLAYMLVGNSYAGQKISGNEVENQAVYWVAVDYFKQARSKSPDLASRINDMISQCEKVYPLKKELFFFGVLEEGIEYKVGGWINEKTTVRFRKE